MLVISQFLLILSVFHGISKNISPKKWEPSPWWEGSGQCLEETLDHLQVAEDLPTYSPRADYIINSIILDIL